MPRELHGALSAALRCCGLGNKWSRQLGELGISDENEIRGNGAQKQCKVTAKNLPLQQNGCWSGATNKALTSDSGTRNELMPGAGWGT
jgi:hypothetical protein